MANTYNYLRTVFQNLKNENKLNNAFIPALLVLLSIPLIHGINNVAMALLLLIAIITFKKANFTFQKNLIIPILLYVLMLFSFFWSIDKESTLAALSKEIPLLLIPIAFLLFKSFSNNQRQKLISYFSYSILLLVLYYATRAVIRYLIFNDSRVFFYHGENDDDYGLVPKLLNAIHVSIYVAIAFFYFFTKTLKAKLDLIIAAFLFLFIILLSSKNIILMVILLTLVYIFFYSKSAHNMRLKNLIVLGLLIGIIFSIGKIKNRFQEEFKSNSDKSLSTSIISGAPPEVHYVSLKEAWTNEEFTANDYFPGTAFRVYQFRIFLELLKEDKIFWKGYGLNASKIKILEKEKQYNLYPGYGTFNFHNQYTQNFAELGIFGFILLLIMLIVNVKNAIKSKDFVHFAFAILMISLFLTESFLWRQRGVVFFTIMYCLFNSKSVDLIPIIEEKNI